MLKKTISLIIISLFFTGCFGDDNGDSDIITTTKSFYETETFSIQFPPDWEILESGDFTSNIPSSTVVGFRNNIKSEVFTANLNISVGDFPRYYTRCLRNLLKPIIKFHQGK